jgi:hypothetical protein
MRTILHCYFVIFRKRLDYFRSEVRMCRQSEISPAAFSL